MAKTGDKPQVVSYQTQVRVFLRWGGASPGWPQPWSPGVGRSHARLGNLDGRFLQTQAALGGVGLEAGLPQLPQDRPQLSEVDIPAGPVDYDVFDVCCCVRLVWPQELVHHQLECGGCAMDALDRACLALSC